MVHTQNQVQFPQEVTRDHGLSRTFYLIKIQYVLAEL